MPFQVQNQQNGEKETKINKTQPMFSFGGPGPTQEGVSTFKPFGSGNA